MSVDPGKIRVYQADNRHNLKSGSSKICSPEPPKPKKTFNHPKVSPDKATAAARMRPEPLDLLRVKQRLLLNDKQKIRLQALFMAPKVLAGLLRAYPQKLASPADTSLFLLKNRKELDDCINPDARGRAVDLLTELLLQWSGMIPETITIDFDDASLTPDQQVYLPLEGLRRVPVEDPMQLFQQRKGRLFQQPFSLFEEGGQYFIAVTLTPKHEPVVTASSLQLPKSKAHAAPKAGKLKDFRPKEIKLLPGQPKPYISGMRNQPTEPRQRVLYSKYSSVFSAGLKAMNWGSLSGWGVNGGLPSLGKKSK